MQFPDLLDCFYSHFKSGNSLHICYTQLAQFGARTQLWQRRLGCILPLTLPFASTQWNQENAISQSDDICIFGIVKFFFQCRRHQNQKRPASNRVLQDS